MIPRERALIMTRAQGRYIAREHSQRWRRRAPPTEKNQAEGGTHSFHRVTHATVRIWPGAGMCVSILDKLPVRPIATSPATPRGHSEGKQRNGIVRLP